MAQTHMFHNSFPTDCWYAHPPGVLHDYGPVYSDFLCSSFFSLFNFLFYLVVAHRVFDTG